MTRLSATLSPSGRIVLHARPSAKSGDLTLSAKTADAIQGAFTLSTGHGLLHLGAAELDTDLDATLRYWRELGRQFVAAACAAIDPMAPAELALPGPDLDALAHLAATAPPMRGAERLDLNLLIQLWNAMGDALTDRAAEFEDGVQGFLHAAHSVWHIAGRVCLHLAENRNNPEFPFAFIATYARQLPGTSALQTVPLSRALQEFAGARNTKQLLTLLTPLQRASNENKLIGDLVDSGDIYHPLAWTAAQAHAFLSAADGFEKTGLILRLPDWWRAKKQSRPTVSVTIGDKKPSIVGMGALLDFNIALTLNGEALTEAEIIALRKASAGLVLLKGQWIESDPEKLSQVLDQWDRVAAQVESGGVSFATAMRLLSGTDDGFHADDLDTRPQWSDVVAGDWLSEQLGALLSPQALDSISERANLNATLRPYQIAGVHWLSTLRTLGLGGCLADDMGLGKTIQVIALLSMLKNAGETGVDLLVVPASLIENWRREIERFAPHLNVFIAHPSKISSAKLRALTPDDLSAHNIVITTYGTAMRTTWMAEFPWRIVTLDEAQAIKNPGSKQTRAIKRLPATWRLALTGTPVENSLGDLWSLFDFLNPGLLGSAKEFSRLCKAMGKAPNGFAPLRALMGPYILRRLKTDRSIIADLPDKTEMTAHCLLTKAQAVLYQQSVDALAQALEDAEGIARRGLVLAYLMRFKQICNHPSQWLGDGTFNPSHSGKFARLAALCEPIAARQEKVLVFTQFRVMVAPLSRHLQDCFGRPGLVLHGGTPVKKRQDLVERFQGDEEIPFMVLSLKAGGTGLNLTAANHVIHFDRWWNPAVENQATDRAYRIGQRRNVLVHKFVCKGTVEERIDALISSKQALSDAVLSGGQERKLTELTNDELLAMVRLDLQSAVSA